ERLEGIRAPNRGRASEAGVAGKIGEPVARAQDNRLRYAVSQSAPRSEIPVMVIPKIAGISPASRAGVRPLSVERILTARVERAEIVVPVSRTRLKVPAQSQIHGQPGRGAPVVLTVKGQILVRK